MTLVVIAVLGALALVAILCALDAGWRQSDPLAIRALLADAPEDVERTLTAELLSGAITGEQYRAATGALAAGEPQPAALQRLVR
ncbi:MAG: hypothetical protein ACRDU4_10040 [Mycobacterium sp.]